MEYDIDILMGIYNCEKYLNLSIESIINQTYKKWRLILCDDGSKDNTYTIAKKYVEKYKDKIILLKNENNMGLNYSLNKCLKYADAEYIARMDADDISENVRLEKEIKFLKKNKEYDFVSCNALLFDDSGIWGKLKLIEKPEKIDFIKTNPFCHAAVIIKRKCLLDVEGYTVDDKLLRVEDYHLWFKLYERGYKGYNIQEILYRIRDDKDATNRRNWKNRKNEYYVRKIGYKMLELPWYYRIYRFRPIILGLMPKKAYEILHKKKLKNRGKK